MSNNIQHPVARNVREQELLASLVYHPFKAQVSQSSLTNISDLITYNYKELAPEILLERVTLVLGSDGETAKAHSAEEIAAIAFGMVQRANETDAFAPTKDEILAKQFIH